MKNNIVHNIETGYEKLEELSKLAHDMAECADDLLILYKISSELIGRRDNKGTQAKS